MDKKDPDINPPYLQERGIVVKVHLIEDDPDRLSIFMPGLKKYFFIEAHPGNEARFAAAATIATAAYYTGKKIVIDYERIATNLSNPLTIEDGVTAHRIRVVELPLP